MKAKKLSIRKLLAASLLVFLSAGVALDNCHSSLRRLKHSGLLHLPVNHTLQSAAAIACVVSLMLFIWLIKKYLKQNRIPKKDECHNWTKDIVFVCDFI